MLLAFDRGAVLFLQVLGIESLEVHAYFGRQLKDHRAIRDANAIAAVLIPTERNPERRKNFFAALEVNRFAVNQSAVEVAQNRVETN